MRKMASCYVDARFLSQSADTMNRRLSCTAERPTLCCHAKGIVFSVSFSKTSVHNHIMACVTVKTTSLHMCACMCLSHSWSLSHQPMTASQMGNIGDTMWFRDHVVLHATIFARWSLAAAHTGDMYSMQCHCVCAGQLWACMMCSWPTWWWHTARGTPGST